MNNPRYMQKLGIVRNMINQESLQIGAAKRDQIVVDELCNMIRKGCTLAEFKKAAKEFMNTDEERKEGDVSPQQEIDLEFFSTLGTQGWSALHAAVTQNNLELVEYLLTKKRVNPNIKGKDDWSPLEIAIQSGFFQMVNLLLEDKRTQVNSVNNSTRGSVLHLAAKSGYLPVCQVLLLKGVDLGIRDVNGLLAK